MSREIPTSPQSAVPLTSPVSPLTANDPREMGPYALTGRLGHGGMGVVYLGEDATGMRAAVKAILPELTSDPGFRARFEREIEAAKKVQSRFTARVLAADPAAEQPWMASEYVADPPLNKLIGSGQRLSEIDVRQMVAGVAEALAAVHAAGLVHRDIKPGNILYGETPCVIDMGIARSVDGTALTQTGKAVGTYGYQAPEQVQTGTFSSAVDIWALGLVAFVAATGHWPFSGEIGSMGHLLKGESPNLSLCPNYLRPLVAACLAEEPTARPSAADILATNGDWTLLPAPVTSKEETTVGALPPALTGGGIARAPRPPAGPSDTADLPTRAPVFAEPSRPSRRRWKVAVMAAAAVVLVSAGVAVAANPGLLPGQDDDAPQVGEMSPSTEPTTGESSTAPTTPVGGAVETGTKPGYGEEPADEGTEDGGEIVPSGTPRDDATPSESAEPSTSPSDPPSESASVTPTAEPTETETVEPTEEPVEEPTETASP